jgi:hypothetical protein
MELDIDYEKAATDMKTTIVNPIDMSYMNRILKVCRFSMFIQHTQLRCVDEPPRRVEVSAMR